MEHTLNHSKVLQIIENMGSAKSGGFNFDVHVGKVRKVIGRSTHILRTHPIERALLVINPIPPMLLGLPGNSSVERIHGADS